MHNQADINILVFCYLVRDGKKIRSVYKLHGYTVHQQYSALITQNTNVMHLILFIR